MSAARHHAPPLLQTLRRRASSRLCAMVLSVFALGIASQSLLGTLVNLHELTSPAHAHVHGADGHLAAHDHEAAVHEGTDSDEGGPLHVLMHHTHCCSHSVWMSGEVAVVAMAATAPNDRSVDRPRPLKARDLTAPFRPPIAV